MQHGEFQYSLEPGENLLLVARRFRVTLNQLLSANPQFRSDPDCARAGNKLVIPNAQLEDSLVRFSDFSEQQRSGNCCSREDNVDFLRPQQGLLSFETNGSENRGRHFSRKPHVPDASSGVTIGRGYSLKDRAEQEIVCDLMESCVDAADARSLAGCRHLSGAKARRFLHDMGYNRIEISLESQYRLHQIWYSELSGSVQRLCRRMDVVDKYGFVDWQKLPQCVCDLVIDLHACGDYTNATRERLQPALVSGNVEDLLHIMSDQYYWLELRAVAPDRFEARKQFIADSRLNNAVGTERERVI